MKNTLCKSFFTLLCFAALGNSISAQHIIPTVDTNIDQKLPDAPQGTASGLVIRTSANYNRISFLEFDLSSLNGKLSKAELCMYLFVASAANKSDIVELYEVTSGDINNDITWSNFDGKYTLSPAPITSLTIATGAAVSDSYGWYRFDIKDYINTKMQTVTAKRIIIAVKAKTTNLKLNFYSNDYNGNPEYRPYLNIKPEKGK